MNEMLDELLEELTMAKAEVENIRNGEYDGTGDLNEAMETLKAIEGKAVDFLSNDPDAQKISRIIQLMKMLRIFS